MLLVACSMLPQTFTFNEGLAVGKPIGIVVALPSDSSQTIVFRIVGVLGLNTISKWGAKVRRSCCVDLIAHSYSLFRVMRPQLGYNASAYNSTFAINSCSGLITVADSSTLVYRNVQASLGSPRTIDSVRHCSPYAPFPLQNFTVTVAASPDGQQIGTVFANMTLVMLQVRL
jgi:hypothetical protein